MAVSKFDCYGCWWMRQERCTCNDCIDCGEFMGIPVDMSDDGSPCYYPEHVCKEEE